MKNNNKEHYLNLLVFIGMPILIVIGIVTVSVFKSNRLIALGGLFICFAAGILLLWLIRVLALRSIKKGEEKEKQKVLFEKQNLIDEKRQEFKHNTDYPETNTVKLVDAGVEFYATGRFVCEKDFKNVHGNHLAFEINSTELKYMPEDYDDVCDLESAGILVSVGYHDGEALEEYANDNGVILKDTLENSVGQTITLKPEDGYSTCVWTVEGDEIDYGFVKILAIENDVLTVYFSLAVSYGLCDTVEGVVELKRDTGDGAHGIDRIIDRIKRKKYNTVDVSDEDVQAIKQAHPFLPESYITFLREVGFVDFDWIDIGHDAKTPTNLDADEVEHVKGLLAKCDGKNYDLDDFYFIGIDSDGRYYAFSRDPDDKKVYEFSDDKVKATTYETFEELLGEILAA